MVDMDSEIWMSGSVRSCPRSVIEQIFFYVIAILMISSMLIQEREKDLNGRQSLIVMGSILFLQSKWMSTKRSFVWMKMYVMISIPVVRRRSMEYLLQVFPQNGASVNNDQVSAFDKEDLCLSTFQHNERHESSLGSPASSTLTWDKPCERNDTSILLDHSYSSAISNFSLKHDHNFFSFDTINNTASRPVTVSESSCTDTASEKSSICYVEDCSIDTASEAGSEPKETFLRNRNVLQHVIGNETLEVRLL